MPPTGSYMRWRYHYPQGRFPYEDLLAENGRRTRLDPEYELVDTGIFAEDRFWVVEVEWAKADPHDLLWRITVHNAGPDEATIDVLPTMWYRNLWSWGVDLKNRLNHHPRCRRRGDDRRSNMVLGKRALVAASPAPTRGVGLR